MSRNEIFSLSTHIPSLELVTGLPNSTKGVAKGYVVVLGHWVDKTSFDQLNKLFVISAREQNHETLLIEQNLLKLV